jgi:predicted GNAT superfamily acetyltransferase
MMIRPLTTLDECRQVVALERQVWGYTDAEDVVPPPILIVSIKRGGILLGAFDADGQMKGFVYSMAALKDGRPSQWSHMLGVAADARDSGLGRRLKLAQRERALEMGVDLIEWTFDPLQALNAHLNFARLGVVCDTYEENIYGDSSSPLHQGSPTDRFIAEWRLRDPMVARKLTGPVSVDATEIPIVNPSRAEGAWLVPGDADLHLDVPRLRVEIPIGFSEMQAAVPDAALAWRLATRRMFLAYFPRYRAVDFVLAREERRGWYVLGRV